MFIVSKALDMSREVMIVRLGGFFVLKPAVIVLLIWWRAVVVECFFLKPCWNVWVSVCSVMKGTTSFSRVLAMGERREIGL